MIISLLRDTRATVASCHSGFLRAPRSFAEILLSLSLSAQNLTIQFVLNVNDQILRLEIFE